MTPEQQIQAWAQMMASRFEGKVKTIPNARYRARALRDILNDIRPGLSNQVTAATVALQKQGVQPLDTALHQALVRRLEIYIRSVLKSGGAFDAESDLGDMSGQALGTFDATRFSAIMSGVTESLSAIGEAAVGITGAVFENQQARREASAARAAAERQADIEELRARGEIAEAERQAELAQREEDRRARDLELRELESERRTRLEEERAEREAREAEIAEEEAAARQLALQRAQAASGGGVLVPLLVVLTLGGGAAGLIYYFVKRNKKTGKGK